jgi:hypothetical protein
MTNAAILERLSDLPARTRGRHQGLLRRGDLARTIAACMAHREAKQAALAASSNWPRNWARSASSSRTASARSRTAVELHLRDDPRQADLEGLEAHGSRPGRRAAVPCRPSSRKASGQGEIEAVEPIPNDNAIIDLVGAPDTIRYGPGRRNGSCDGRRQFGRDLLRGLRLRRRAQLRRLPQPVPHDQRSRVVRLLRGSSR